MSFRRIQTRWTAAKTALTAKRKKVGAIPIAPAEVVVSAVVDRSGAAVDYTLTVAAAGIIIAVGDTIKGIIIYMKKLLDSEWSRAVHILCNSVQKSVIPCRNL